MNTILTELLPIDEQTHKHRCLVRQLLKYRATWGLRKFQNWIEDPKTKKIWEPCKAEFFDQWKKGNRGDWAVWL